MDKINSFRLVYNRQNTYLTGRALRLLWVETSLNQGKSTDQCFPSWSKVLLEPNRGPAVPMYHQSNRLNAWLLIDPSCHLQGIGSQNDRKHGACHALSAAERCCQKKEVPWISSFPFFKISHWQFRTKESSPGWTTTTPTGLEWLPSSDWTG